MEGIRVTYESDIVRQAFTGHMEKLTGCRRLYCFAQGPVVKEELLSPLILVRIVSSDFR
jgi:hypothetical protein